MTALAIFAYVVLPVVVVAMGYAAVRYNESQMHHPHPGE